MVEDIAEGIVKTIFRFILEILFRIIVEGFFFYTGEILLFLITGGKRKPRWNYYTDEYASKFMIFTELSTWLGMAFWLFIAWFVNSMLLK